MNILTVVCKFRPVGVIILAFWMTEANAFAQDHLNWLDLSFTYIEQNKLDSAEFALKMVLKEDPTGQLNPFLLNNLGTIQRRLGRQQESLLSYTAALGQYPRNTIFLESRASLFAEMNQPENAILDYSMLLSIESGNEEALYQRGLLYLQVKNQDLAEADFRKMLDLNPDGLYARMGMASLAKFSGDYENAEKIYNYLIDKEPTNANLYAGRAELYLLMEKPGKSSADATKAIRLSEFSNPYLYITRCKAKIQQHEKKSALEDLEQAISLGYDPAKAIEIRKVLQQK